MRNVQHIFAICSQCGQSFDTTRLDADTCSPKCRIAKHRAIRNGKGKDFKYVSPEAKGKYDDMKTYSNTISQMIEDYLKREGADKTTAFINNIYTAFVIGLYGNVEFFNQNLKDVQERKELLAKARNSFGPEPSVIEPPAPAPVDDLEALEAPALADDAPPLTEWRDKPLTKPQLKAIAKMNDYRTVWREDVRGAEYAVFKNMCAMGIFAFDPDDENGGSFDFTSEGYDAFGTEA